MKRIKPKMDTKLKEPHVWQDKYEPYVIDESIEIDLTILPKNVQHNLKEWEEILKTENPGTICAFSSVIAADFYEMGEFDEIDDVTLSKLWAKYLNNRF